jgi:hypothetical protein
MNDNREEGAEGDEHMLQANIATNTSTTYYNSLSRGGREGRVDRREATMLTMLNSTSVHLCTEWSRTERALLR